MTTTDREGFGLACQHCGFRFPLDVTVGVAAAHFETEHNTTDVKFELVVLCRDDTVMVLNRRDGDTLYYDCPKCHRTRRVSQLDAPGA